MFPGFPKTFLESLFHVSRAGVSRDNWERGVVRLETRCEELGAEHPEVVLYLEGPCLRVKVVDARHLYAASRYTEPAVLDDLKFSS